MSGVNDLPSIQQTGVGILSVIQQVLAKAVPTDSSGHLSVDTLVQSGFMRVIGVSVLAGSGAAKLHDAAALADAAGSNAIYLVPTTTGYYPTNMVFHKGLVLKIGTATEIAIFYVRV